MVHTVGPVCRAEEYEERAGLLRARRELFGRGSEGGTIVARRGVNTPEIFDNSFE